MSHMYRAVYTFHTVGGPTTAYSEPNGSLAVVREEGLHVQRTYKTVGVHVQKRDKRGEQPWQSMDYEEWNPNKEGRS